MFGKIKRFLIYSFLGLLIEVVWTGLGAILIQGNITMTGHTSLWMLPVYGLGGLLFESIHNKLRNKDIVIRLVVWIGTIYAIEYTAGLILNNVFGVCPWYYSGPLSIGGYITLTFLPAWALMALAFERFHNFLDGRGLLKKNEQKYVTKVISIFDKFNISIGR